MYNRSTVKREGQAIYEHIFGSNRPGHSYKWRPKEHRTFLPTLIIFILSILPSNLCHIGVCHIYYEYLLPTASLKGIIPKSNYVKK